jgi:urease accessory protein UreH
MFSSHTRFELKDGSKIKLWDDVCYGKMALKEAFTGLYSIICVKDAFLAIHLNLSSGSLK